METFDQIMPTNFSGNEVRGYLRAMNEEFYIQLTVEGAASQKKISLKGCEKMQKVLHSVIDTLEQHLYQSNSMKDMLSEIQNALEQQIRAEGVNTHIDPHMQYSTLFEQLSLVGWDKVNFISPDFQSLHLKAIDESEREHILKIWIPEKFPNEAPKYECDLPQEFNYKWLPNDSLLDAFNAFQETLMKFCDFWNILDEIDAKTWVLEPENPTRKDCKRRIVLSSGISLLIIINPVMPSSIPMCHYLGPERIVEPVREKFNKNIRLWNEYDTLLTNLQQVLEVEFPSPETTTKEEFCMECGICYSYQLGDAIPDMNCEEPKCNQPFHHACLYEYIRMLPDVRSGFNKLFGECPYCSKPIWCTIP